MSRRALPRSALLRAARSNGRSGHRCRFRVDMVREGISHHSVMRRRNPYRKDESSTWDKHPSHVA
jgi:hypothetical protein